MEFGVERFGFGDSDRLEEFVEMGYGICGNGTWEIWGG